MQMRLMPCEHTAVLKMIKCYSELSMFETFDDRFDYLKLEGIVGEETFGFDRILNQIFYKNDTWKRLRNEIIIRDNGCDLGVPGYDIEKGIIVHHMNPISVKDLEEESKYLLDPEYLICVSLKTHNAIHYGDRSLLEGRKVVERRKGDTCPWKVF